MPAKRCSICSINHPTPGIGKKNYTHCINCGDKLDYLANADPDPHFEELLAEQEREAAARKAEAVNRQMFEDYYIEHSVKNTFTDEDVLTSESMKILGIDGGEI